jgi:hypothetical protein
VAIKIASDLNTELAEGDYEEVRELGNLRVVV